MERLGTAVVAAAAACSLLIGCAELTPPGTTRTDSTSAPHPPPLTARPVRLQFDSSPASGEAATLLTPFRVRLLDSAGGLVRASTDTVELRLLASDTAARLLGRRRVAADLSLLRSYVGAD